MEKCELCNVELIPYIDEDLSCSCHICAPCSKCCSELLECPVCKEIIESKAENNTKEKEWIPPAPSSSIESEISFTTQRSQGWVLIEGTFKLGLSSKEVQLKLNNGSDFDKYHMFKMKAWNTKEKLGYGYFKCSYCTN